MATWAFRMRDELWSLLEMPVPAGRFRTPDPRVPGQH